MITKPMLAAKLESEDQIQFPIWASPKLDGIRCLVINGKAVTRKFKQIPNKYIREQIEKYCPTGFDGEIIVPNASFNEIQSFVMSEDGEPNFEYHVFDYVKSDLNESWMFRSGNVKHYFEEKKVSVPGFFRTVPITLIQDKKELLQYEKEVLIAGFEGVILRKPDSPYKCGRATVREQYLMKLKRFEDSEAKVIGFEEKNHNENEATIDELGHTKRSHHKANMIPAGTLGKLVVVDPKFDEDFKVGTGFNDELRKEIWNNKEKFLGKLIKYKYQEIGTKDKPRIPVFLGFRDKRDL